MKKIIKPIVITVLLLVVFTFYKQYIHYRIGEDESIRAAAQQKISYLQQLYNQNSMKDIYAETTAEFKKKTPEDIFILMMKKKTEVLGSFKQSQLQSSKVINHSTVILSYRSTYQHYSLIEEFELVKVSDNGKLQLNAYFIDDAGKRGEVIKL